MLQPEPGALQGSPKTPGRVAGLLFVARPGARSKPGARRLLCVQHGVRAAARDNSTASEVFSQPLINVRASETAGKAHKPLSGQVPKHSISNRSDARGRRRRRGD